ncbi:ATP-binding protein [Agromyces sp. NPDC058484]|uniref:ATP-binding protein n=1 Tax=Agromyces sp. NPDC058484 TaxID=3346524 RepID=UPI003646644C
MTLLEFPTETQPAPAESVAGQWRLARIELVNWGTFDGHHRIDVARKGHLFTGASGSGKSSLLDAIACVLTPDKWLRFNAAAQDATSRGDDRSLVSYVRGAWSNEADETYDRAVSAYLRRGATWSGVLLRYENLRDAPVTLVRLFHLRGVSADKSDLRDLCLIDRSDLSLTELREFVAGGVEARRLKAARPEASVTSNFTHGAFYAKFRRIFGIDHQNALHLLHKTQSAKNLGSLDQLFRTFMLDEPKTFARAKSAVEQFGELDRAHAHIVELRKQADELRALETVIAEYETATDAATEADRLTTLLDPFHDRLTLRLADEERVMLRAEEARLRDLVARCEAAVELAEERRTDAERRALELGGGDAEREHELLRLARQAADETEKRWRRLAETLRSVEIDHAPADAAEFAELRETAARELAAEAPQAQHDNDDHRAYFTAQRDLRKVDAELDALKRRRSNLPAELLVARQQLADELGLAEQALPFVGELVEVLPEFAEWTGAIERVLYPIASAMLVRDDVLAEVRRRVDRRHLGARLVFEAVPAVAPPVRKASDARSLLHRIRVVDGPFAEWLQARLGAEFDLVCVDSVDELDAVDRGVTLSGQIKKSARRYEKNDRFRIDDRRRWILGADNEAKIELLLERRRVVARELEASDHRLQAAARRRDELTSRRTVFASIAQLEWAELDRAGAEAKVEARRRRLEELTEGNDELRDAVDAREAAIVAARDAQKALSNAEGDLRNATDRAAALDRQIAELGDRVAGVSIDEADVTELERRYREKQRSLTRDTLEKARRLAVETLHRELDAARRRQAAAEGRFVEGATVFKTNWRTAATELTAQIGDRGGYRELLAGIVSRGLPEHEGNFMKLLRERSRDQMGLLASDLRNAPKEVADRIAPVNASLGTSPFDHDRFLRIEVRVQRSSEVTEFLADLQTITQGSWEDESLDSAERRFGVLKKVMTKLGSSENADLAWRRRCLDTREHVTFLAKEIDRGGRVVNLHESSAGLSGGQRQKLVVFCLAAALRYQLTADEDHLPSYATIILDEAFDKADSRYTRMAMDVFVEFGFQMLLATPQKLLQTIEPYVGAVTTIDNPTRKLSQIANLAFDLED